MTKRSIRFTVLAAPLILGLAACAGAPDPGAESSAGGTIAETAAVPGTSPQASWPGSQLPILSFDDREAIGRVAYAEAGNQGEEGIAAVVFTILNRVNSGQFGSSAQAVVDARNQFEPATRAGGWRYLPRLDSWQSVQYETILNLIYAGRLPDLTNGALYFQNAEIVAARAARGAVSPYLVDFGGTPPVAVIGDHSFYDWRAGVNLAAQRYGGGYAPTTYHVEDSAYEDPPVYEPVPEYGVADSYPDETSSPLAYDTALPGEPADVDAATTFDPSVGIVSEPSDPYGCPAGAVC